MQVNPFNLMFKCEKCEKTFYVSTENAPNSLTHKKEYKINGQSIFLTYYDCPHCSKRHFVQIDDATSLEMLSGVTKEFCKLAAKRKRGIKVSKRQLEKFTKSRQYLSDYRMNLMKEFTGKTIYDNETGTEIELRFSV